MPFLLNTPDDENPEEGFPSVQWQLTVHGQFYTDTTNIRSCSIDLKFILPSYGGKCPLVLLSHVEGCDDWLYSYQRTCVSGGWAASGFVVLIAKPVESQLHGKQRWESRIKDLKMILTSLKEIEEKCVSLQGRIDYDKIAVVGHFGTSDAAASLLGASTVPTLKGAPGGGPATSYAEQPVTNGLFHGADDRIKCGILFSPYGEGGDSLSQEGEEKIPFYNPDFSTMSKPVLIVRGEVNADPLEEVTCRGSEWFEDAYKLSPGVKDLFVLKARNHPHGGIPGFDWNASEKYLKLLLLPVVRVTIAWLKFRLKGEEQSAESWAQIVATVRERSHIGYIESKGY